MELPSKVYNEDQYVIFDDVIIRWHITDKDELDYSKYYLDDGGRLSLPDNATIEYIEQLLEGE